MHGREGWLTLFDKASAGAREVAGAAAVGAEAARNAHSLALLAAALDEASRWLEALTLYEQAIDAGDAELRRLAALVAPSAATHPSELTEQRERSRAMESQREEVWLRRSSCAERAVAMRAALGKLAPPPFSAEVAGAVAAGAMAVIQEGELHSSNSPDGAPGGGYANHRVAYTISLREMAGVEPAGQVRTHRIRYLCSLGWAAFSQRRRCAAAARLPHRLPSRGRRGVGWRRRGGAAARAESDGRGAQRHGARRLASDPLSAGVLWIERVATQSSACVRPPPSNE